MANTVIIEKTNELLSGHCAEELRTAAQAWLAAVDTDKEAEATDEYIAQLQDGIMAIDDVINFMGSDFAKEKFGDMAGQLCTHAKEVKENGGEWCDCPACSLAIEILGLFDDEDTSGRMILEFDDDSKVECDIVCVFEVEDQLRIVLLPDDGSEDVLIYGYKDKNEEEFDLYDLTDEEFEAASKAFDQLLKD